MKSEKYLIIHTKNKKDMLDIGKYIGMEINPKRYSASKNINSIGFNLDYVPEFDNVTTENYYTLKIPLTKEIIKQFDLENDKKSIVLWFPKRPKLYREPMIYITTTKVNPIYPVYIISKGRYESRLTSIALEKMKVPYKIVIEPQEYDLYVKNINSKNIIILPSKYLNKNQGSIPARNFCWDHSIKNGFSHHWILDDNIRRFFRFNKNKKIEVQSGVCFRVIEDMVKQFDNVGLAGMQYSFFIPENNSKTPIAVKNTRIYSCILINNSLKHRWRGVYNEDTDLSLRVLKDGISTILFNNFLCDKQATLSIKGGNTNTIYNVENGLLKKVESLIEQHPDVVKLINKFNRPHHLVNYKPFKNNLLVKTNFKPKFPKEYFMELVPKLTPEIKKEIKKLLKDDKYTLKEIAEVCNVNKYDIKKLL